jgi:hypothetical protein
MRAWLAAAAALAGACASATAPVPLSATWPERVAGAYDDVYQRWTRRGEDRAELVQTVTVSATLQSAEFRAAYVHERARRLQLPPDEEQRLADAERHALAEGWEVELLVATAKPDWNDLRKHDKPKDGKGSMWRLALVGDGGREVEPLSVKEDRRHRDDVGAYFPDLQPFFQAYVVRFPRTTADGRALVGDGGRLALKVGGALGQVELVWSAR